MDDKLNTKGRNGKKDGKGDEMLKSPCSQTTGSEFDAEDAEQTEVTVVEHDVQIRSNGGPAKTLYVCRQCSVQGHQPKPLHSLLPPFKEVHQFPDVSRPLTKTRSQKDGLKTSSAHTEADGSDLCAAILLHCLFCRPLDCLLETLRGCTLCVCSLCSSLCGCEPVAMRPLLEFTPCACPGAGRLLCDCAGCDICLPATECLDLAMEVSQMLYH